MLKPTVLVSGLGGDVSQSVAMALKGRYRLIGCDCQGFKPYRQFVEHFVQVPAAINNKDFLKAMAKLIRRYKVDFYIPVPEAELRCLHHHRSLIEKWPAMTLMHNHQVLDAFLDKFNTSTYLEHLGVPVPKTQLLKDVDPNRCRLPAVIKSRFGCGGRHVRYVVDRRDVSYWKQKDQGELIFQENVGAPEEEYTSAVFSDGKKVEVVSFRRKLHSGGFSREIEHVHAPALFKIGKQVAENTNLKGSINIQSRKLGGKFYVFEINPRLSSTVLLRRHFGFDDAHWWISILSGKPWQFKLRHEGGRGYRFLREVYMDGR